MYCTQVQWLDDFVAFTQDCLGGREREALYTRGVTDEQIDLYQLGYIDAHLPEGKYPQDFLEWWTNHNWQLDDCFVLPLTTTLGHTLGIQVRHVDRARKGYLDYYASDEEAALFGLGQAMPAVWETGDIWLVEGGFDVFPLQRHLSNVTATLHAGIGNDFWRVLKRVASRVYLAYDSDGAGRKASYDIVRGDHAKDFDFKIVKFPNVPYKGGKMTTDPSELWDVWGDKRLGVFLSQSH